MVRPARPRPISRRLFLTDFGRGTMAVAVLGLAACSSDSDPGSTDAGGSTTTTSRTDASPTTGAEAQNSAGQDAETSSEEAVGDLLQWEQVSFGFVSAYVLVRGSEVAIVDTGTDGSRLEEGLAAVGRGWGDVRHVIATHSHGDHVGGLGVALSNAANAVGYAGTADLGSISVDADLQGLDDGDEVFGLQIVGTPGHTPGHISVYDEASRLLVAGDSLNTSGGRITGANPDFTPDMSRADQSVRDMAALSVDTVLVGHGDPVVGSAGSLLTELADSLG